MGGFLMALAALFNVPLNEAELSAWAFAHAVHHNDMAQAIQTTYSISMPSFILDPISLQDAGVWAEQHQEVHRQMRTVLNISGFDLSEVDWRNPERLASWIQANAAEHVQAAGILNVA